MFGLGNSGGSDDGDDKTKISDTGEDNKGDKPDVGSNGDKQDDKGGKSDKKSSGSGYAGKICEMPYANVAITNSRRSFMNWLKGTETMNF